MGDKTEELSLGQFIECFGLYSLSTGCHSAFGLETESEVILGLGASGHRKECAHKVRTLSLAH